MSEYDHLKAQFDRLRALEKQRPNLPPLASLPQVDVSAFRAAMLETVPPVVITRYGKPRWVLWAADFYNEDLAISQGPEDA